MKRLYVGNLVYGANEEDIRNAFAPYGEVSSVHVVMDRETGRSRGFAFVEMADGAQADQAIEALNGCDFGGRDLVVNEARPRPERTGGGGGFGGGRGAAGGGAGRRREPRW
ncbi:MAG: RNA-binding protein [Acidobacteria bacterium]|nr:RNA-binding protein [Acidobacteriota bacterium]